MPISEMGGAVPEPSSLAPLISAAVEGVCVRGDRREAAGSVASAIRDASSCRWVGIYDVNPRQVSIFGSSGSELPQHPIFPADRGLSGTAISTRDVVVSNDVARDERYLSAFATTGSELIAPILGRNGTVIGTLDLESDDVGAFSTSDADRAAALAALLAHLLQPVALRVGNVEIVPLIDAHGSFGTFGELFAPSEADTEATARATYPELFAGDRWILPFRAFVVRADFTALVDAGVGPVALDPHFLPERQGWLLDEMQRSGIEVDDVDLVAFTHLHEDHIGWASVEGSATFPRARVLVNRAEWDWNMRPDRARYAEHLAPLNDVELLDGEREIMRDVVMIPTPGHTPGHMSVRVGAEENDVVILGDVAVHPQQLSDPSLYYELDDDRETAAATRRKCIDSLEASSSLIACGHYPGLGVGRLSPRDGGARWSVLSIVEFAES